MKTLYRQRRDLTLHRMISAFWTWLHWFWQQCLSFWQRYTGPKIALDSGKTVRIGRQLAEGGFSYVFEATDVDRKRQRYALKRIPCPEPDILQACQKEAAIHRAVRHPNLMPLLGLAIDKKNAICYMLFPLYPHSLRSEVNRRTLERPLNRTPTEAPWSELQALELFDQILSGVAALHGAHYSHRDIKLENILMTRDFQPVLMDFGSAGPLQQSIECRRDVLFCVENAAMHTTLPYRPPELLEGGVRPGEAPLDYTAVDVWSLGCTLFALLYGASPKECEFASPRRHGHAHAPLRPAHWQPQSQQRQQQQPQSYLKIIECTPLSILSDRLPVPPEHSEAATWYSSDVHSLIRDMLTHDRHGRATLSHVQSVVANLIPQQGGRRVIRNNTKSNATSFFQDHYHGDDDDDDGRDATEMSLISHRV